MPYTIPTVSFIRFVSVKELYSQEPSNIKMLKRGELCSARRLSVAARAAVGEVQTPRVGRAELGRTPVPRFG